MKHARGFLLLATAAFVFGLASNQVVAADRSSAKGKTKQAAQYPDTNRTEPKLDLTSDKDQKALNAGLDAVNDDDDAKAQELLQPLVDKSKSKYAQALALQGLANLRYKADDAEGAISLLQRALDIGVMPNDTYFQLMYVLAQFQLNAEQYQATLDTVAKWRAEGKKETADSYALEGNAYYRLSKYPEAIAAIKKAQSMTDKPEPTWNQILMASYAESGQDNEAAELAAQQLAANPNDATALRNATALLLQQQKYPEAIKLFEQARASGTLKEQSDWINLMKAYILLAQDEIDVKGNGTKALEVFDDGLAKGNIQASAENFKLAGDAAIIGDNESRAISYYQKGVPLATDGELDLAVGRQLLQEQKYSDAKKSIQTGITKGVKQKGTAYMLLAESERGMKNKAGAIAAMKLAAQQPETAEKAKAWLKTAGAGN